MNPDVEDFLDKFSQDAEDLIRNVAAFNQLAHIRNHSYKQSTHPCHQRFPERPEPPITNTLVRPIPKKKVDSSPQGTQTCQCLSKQIKSTNTGNERKSNFETDDYQNKRRSTSQEQRSSSVSKRPSSIQSQKRCFAEAMPLKSPSSNNKKRGCCQIDESCDDISSTNSHKSDKCVCKSNHGAPVDTRDTLLEIEEFTDKFSDAQRSLQILRNRIADLNYYVNEGEAKMKMKQRSSTMCPPCPPPSSYASGAGYGVPELPQNPLPEFPPLKIKKLIPRNKFLEQGGVENNFSFGNMPVMPPHAVPVLPGTFVGLGRNTCTPRDGGSRRSNQRVSFNSCTQNK